MEKDHSLNQEEASPVDDGARPDVDDDPVFTRKEQRQIIHRLDYRLITVTGALYAISLIDRTNLSFAAVAGMTTDLQMLVSYRYSLIALVFFITYIIFQPPATVVCRYVGPRNFLAAITLIWGGIMIGFGFPNKWTDLIPLRLVLGILEAGLFPGAAYLISTWYSRFDLHKRYSCFYVVGCIASAFGGILAYGLSSLDGRAGLEGWRWIFIIEGILTCALGIASYWLLLDFPDQMRKSTSSRKYLNDQQLDFILRRIDRDRGDSSVEQWNFKSWISAGVDLKIWSYALMFCFTGVVNYSMSYFLPIILREDLGFTVVQAQCLVAPPYAFAAFYMCVAGWLGDKYHIRGPIVALNAVVALIGLPIMGFAKNSPFRYFGVFLVTAGGNSQVPSLLAYQANNITGQWKRAFCSASLVAAGGVGGIAGTLVFRSQDSPQYRPGMIACIVASGLILVLVGLNTLDSLYKNRRAERDGLVIEGTPGFRYTL